MKPIISIRTFGYLCLKCRIRGKEGGRICRTFKLKKKSPGKFCPYHVGKPKWVFIGEIS